MNIIVTGASRGIGFQSALQFSANPNHKVLAVSRNEAGLQLLKESAESDQGHANLSTLSLDLTRLNGIELENALSELGSVDILLNNAGLLINKPFMELDTGDWQRIFGVNLLGAVEMIKAVKSRMGKDRRGHIVNIGSMGGFQGSSKFPGLSAYSASKGALAILTECLAEEFREENISVNCLALGAVQTEMLEQAFPGYQAPLTSEQMGKFVADFCLNQGQVYNGKILPVSLMG